MAASVKPLNPLEAPATGRHVAAKPEYYYFITRQGGVEALSSWRESGKCKDVIESVTWTEE
jgi:hypothetical protein